MTKTIAALWNGNLKPVGKSGINNNEMKELEDVIGQETDRIEGLLSEEEKRLFQAYCDNMNRYLLVSSEQAFCDGYCLGTKIMMEALLGAENVTP